MFILTTILILSLIILIHESGHYLVAKWFGVTTPIFSLGIGPKLFGFKPRETEFRISLLPIGGYLKMKGFMDGSLEPTSDSYPAKPRWQRFLILAAGPSANMVSAFIGAAIVFSLSGIPKITNKIEDVESLNSSAALSLQKKDTIISINGQAVNSAEDMTKAFQSVPGDQVSSVVVSRNNEIIVVTLKPEEEVRIVLTQENVKLSPIDSVIESGKRVSTIIYGQLQFFKELLSGDTSKTKDVMGPVGIIRTGNQISQTLGWRGIGFFAFAISIALGFANLLPIPVLDGGHMTVLCIEAAIGKDISRNIQTKIIMLGLILLLSILGLTTYNDIMR